MGTPLSNCPHPHLYPRARLASFGGRQTDRQTSPAHPNTTSKPNAYPEAHCRQARPPLLALSVMTFRDGAAASAGKASTVHSLQHPRQQRERFQSVAAATYHLKERCTASQASRCWYSLLVTSRQALMGLWPCRWTNVLQQTTTLVNVPECRTAVSQSSKRPGMMVAALAHCRCYDWEVCRATDHGGISCPLRSR